MSIPISPPITIRLVNPVDIVLTDMTIELVSDFPLQKQVVATLIASGQSANVVLWEGADYDRIGQWTDAEVLERVNELATPENIRAWFS